MILRAAELKPCPFCGTGSAGLQPGSWNNVWRIACYGCATNGPTSSSNNDSSIEKWNTRVSPWRSLKDDPPEPNSGWRQVFLRHADGYVKIAELGDDTDITVTGEAWAEGVPELLEKYNFVSWMEVPE